MSDAALADASEPPLPEGALTQDGPKIRLFLVDGYGFVFRAFHVLPALTRKSDGAPTGAVMGFSNMLWKLLQDTKGAKAPTHLAVIFDASETTFRSELYSDYKANRPPPPEDLVPQFPLVREATRAFGVPCVELNGYEADDLIASYACAVRALGGETVIVSSDKDMMQLVGDGVTMWDPIKEIVIDRDQVVEKFGVQPEKVVDVQALVGDSVDNVPGAPGIGVKTASQLITEYGDLDTLLARAGEIKQPKRRETLENFRDQILLSRELVRLTCDTPLPEPVDALGIRHPDPAVLSEFLERMEFRSLARRVGDGKVEARAPAPAAPQPLPADAAQHAFDHDKYPCIQTIEDLDLWIARAFEAGVVAFDVETDAATPMQAGLCGLSLAVGPGEAAYVPLGHRAGDGLELGDGGDLRQIDEARALARLKPLLEHPGILKIAHNAKYDLAVLALRGVAVAPIDDPMLISYVLEGGLHGHGLEELSRRWLEHEPLTRKSVAGRGPFRHVEPSVATRVAAQDADVTLRLWRRLKPRLVREGMATVYETLERPLPPVLTEMERAGIRVDPDTLRRLSNDFGQRMATFEAEAHALAGRAFNVGSPKQIGDILFGELNMPGGKKTPSGQWATDASILDELAAAGHPLPRAVLGWRELSKLKGTYTDALIAAADPDTCRVHTTFQLAASNTGRLAASDPNLQNIPIRTDTGRQLRTAFVAGPGNVLISADYSQIELRLLAHIGDIPQLKQAFAEGRDIHAATASEMFGVPIEGMSSQVRSRAKAINFGIVYGISAFGLANQLSIPQDEAGAYIKTYFDRFPGIRAYMEERRKEVRQQGFVTTLFGRKVHIPDITAKSVGQRQGAERVAINAPIQGSAADIIRRAMIRMPGALKDAGLSAKMLLQVHDELVFEAPSAEAEATSRLVERVMERAADPAVALTVPLVVTAKVGRNWDEAH